MQQPYRSWVEVSRSRIAANYQAVRRTVGDAVTIMPVVKADAYRHGATEISRVLEAQGARWLAVSNAEEGIAILVMADYLPFERPAFREFGLTPVIHTLSDVEKLDSIPYHLKIDSGMGRLGTRANAETIADAVSRASHAPLEGLMTHFASSADYTGDQTAGQIRYFEQIVDALKAKDIRPAYVHLSSTNPVAWGRREAWQNMVRPGHAIYGYISPARGNAPPQALTVEPALTWKAAILAVKDVPEGTLIGYGGMFRAPRHMRIAVLAAGYADGIPHRLSNRGKVIAAGKLAPILGAVSMDLTTIEITQAPQLKVGDSVTLLGEEGDVRQDAQQIARLAGTISYSVLCGISARVKRVYID